MIDASLNYSRFLRLVLSLMKVSDKDLRSLLLSFSKQL